MQSSGYRHIDIGIIRSKTIKKTQQDPDIYTQVFQQKKKTLTIRYKRLPAQKPVAFRIYNPIHFLMRKYKWRF